MINELVEHLFKRGSKHPGIPSSNFVGIAELAVAKAVLNHGEESMIVQIGACDGKEDDPLFKYLLRGNIKATLIEPIPASFAKLVEAYCGISEVNLINAAITTEDGEREMYSVKQQGRWELSTFAPMLSSFSKDHLLKHGVQNEEIEVVGVRTIKISTLIKELKIKNIDLMLIDTEGYDAKILDAMIDESIFPQQICFEHVHISLSEVADIYKKLYDNRYLWISDRQNTLATKH
jgi:FkbM family methyltransferase